MEFGPRVPAVWRLVARAGDQAPGTPSGVDFRTADFRDVDLNNAGQSTFNSGLSDGGQGIWSGGSGSLALVARGNGFGVRRPLLNDAGQIAFLGVVNGTDGQYTTGYWLSDTSAGLTELMELGPVGLSGTRGIALNNAGQTAFIAPAPTGELAIWSDRSGSLSVVVRDGDQAPGMPPGVNFASFSNHDTTSNWALNDAAQIAFATPLTGPGVDYTNGESIWSERTGSLALVSAQRNAGSRHAKRDQLCQSRAANTEQCRPDRLFRWLQRRR